MKRKYFVRGLGVGILFGALIMFAAYMTSGKNRMSDEDVIKRAQELGMVKQSEYVLESDVTSQETTTEEITTEATTEKATTEATTTEKTTTEKATTEVSTTEKADTSTQTTVTISSGMSSEAIASALANAGLVDDASKFNSFLVANGYDMKLETGNFSLETGMSYEEIAKILTTKQ